MAAVPIVLAALSALSAMKGARDQKKLLSDLAWRGGQQMNWDKIQKTYGQMFGGPGVLQNRPDINTPGGLLAQSFINALQHAGQLTPVSYIRGQEQANIGQQALSNRGVGMMGQLGMGFNTPLAQSAWGAGPMAAAQNRTEILREILGQQQQQFNVDRGYGAQGIGGMLQSAVDFRKAKGALLQGGAGLQANGPNPWSMLSQGLGSVAAYAANNQPQQQQQENPYASQSGGQQDYLNQPISLYQPGMFSGGYNYNNPSNGYSFNMGPQQSPVNLGASSNSLRPSTYYPGMWGY